jgi:hypothetical protein
MPVSKTLLVQALFVLAATAQTTPAPAPQPAAAPPTWSAGGIDFSGLVDGYYNFNFNHPASRNNTLRYFDHKANQLSMNMLKLTAEHSGDTVGFKTEFFFGRAADTFHATEPGGLDVYKHILQAYVTVKPEGWGGVQFDFGKFVTAAGAEVTETHLNYNYSRGLLYANGPFHHFGARLSAPVNDHLSVGYQLVNGWNNVEDNNAGKTHGFTAAVTTSKINWFNTFYTGPEKTDTTKGWRHFYDTVLNFNPSGKINGLVSFDYGQESNPGARAYKFYGVEGAMRIPMGERFAFAPRYEWYKDRDGFITGTVQTLQEVTFTFEYKLARGFLSRAEYRRDWSSRNYFDRGNEPGSSDHQDTLLAGFVVFFGPR